MRSTILVKTKQKKMTFVKIKRKKTRPVEGSIYVMYRIERGQREQRAKFQSEVIRL